MGKEMKKMDKKKQYEAVKAFGEALHGLTEAGVKWVCDENGPKITIDFSDRDSGRHIAQYGKLDMTAGGLFAIEPPEIEELSLSTEYFGKIAEGKN